MIPLIIGGTIAAAAGFAALTCYRVVPQNEAHIVVTPRKTFVISPQKEQATEKKRNWYLKIPMFFVVRRMDLTIQELFQEQETYEKHQARYNVKSSIKYKIHDVVKAAATFTDEEDLKKQLEEVVRASVRAVTVKYDVADARSQKKKMSDEITKEIEDDLEQWGLKLVSFQLVNFQDTEESNIISNISKRREVAIASKTREENAEKTQFARVKEAESEEKARQREIEKDKMIQEAEQEKLKDVATKAKEAKQEEMKVIRVKTIEQANIDKEKALVEANQHKEVEKINLEKKKLEGEGDRIKLTEQAKGNAAEAREQGKAEADAKEALQKALNKFNDKAIRALVAEKVVEMQKAVGIAGAKALENADVKVFSGGAGDKSAFDIGKLLSSMSVSNDSTAQALLNKIARPNDLGLSSLNLGDKKVVKIARKKK